MNSVLIQGDEDGSYVVSVWFEGSYMHFLGTICGRNWDEVGLLCYTCIKLAGPR